jgi:hypothetical protein
LLLGLLLRGRRLTRAAFVGALFAALLTALFAALLLLCRRSRSTRWLLRLRCRGRSLASRWLLTAFLLLLGGGSWRLLLLLLLRGRPLLLLWLGARLGPRLGPRLGLRRRSLLFRPLALAALARTLPLPLLRVWRRGLRDDHRPVLRGGGRRQRGSCNRHQCRAGQEKRRDVRANRKDHSGNLRM